MKNKCIKYPKVGQFRNVVQSVQTHTAYVGKDENGDPIYDYTRQLPTIKFIGTVKLHGTNAGISFNTLDGPNLWVQSRNRVLTPDHDNAGFAAFVEQNREYFTAIMTILYSEYADKDDTVTLYGEWAGQGIQSGVAIGEIPQTFFIFGLKVTPYSVLIGDQESNDSSYWVDIRNFSDIDINSYGTSLHNIRVKSIYDFHTFEMDIDFANPKMHQNHLIAMTEQVEACCPVAEKLNVKGIGEGIVWTSEDLQYRFKVKGEKHSNSKVKKLAPVDTEKLANINEFAEYVVTRPRVNQGIDEVIIKNGLEPDKKHTGDFLRWFANDVISEEADTLNDNNLIWKDVAKRVQTRARELFFTRLDELVFERSK